MTSLYVFVLVMHMAVFGGPVEARFTTLTEEGCIKLRRVIVRQMEQARLRFEVNGCGDSGPRSSVESRTPASAP